MTYPQAAKIQFSVELEGVTEPVILDIIFDTYDADNSDGMVLNLIDDKLEEKGYDAEVEDYEIIGGYIGIDSEHIDIELTKVHGCKDEVLDLLHCLYADNPSYPDYEAIVLYFDNNHFDFRYFDKDDMLESYVGEFESTLEFCKHIVKELSLDIDLIEANWDYTDLRFDYERFELPCGSAAYFEVR